MDKQQNTPASPPGRRRQSGLPRQGEIFPFLFLVFLCILLAVSAGLLLRKASTELRISRNLAEQHDLLRLQHDQLMDRLLELEEAYSRLSRKYRNLELAFEAEQAEIARLQALLRRGFTEEEREYLLARIASLEALLHRYQVELEALISEHELLLAEKHRVSDSLRKSTDQHAMLEEQKSNMQRKLDKALTLDISDISLTAFRAGRRLRETDRARRVDVLEVCYLVRRNEVAPEGERMTFFQLKGPENQPLGEGERIPFAMEGEAEAYTFADSFYYQNEDKEHCVRWENQEALIPGVYLLTLYMDGRIYPSLSFELR